MWLAGLLAAWAAVLLAGAVWSVYHGPATVRAQSDLAQGEQTVSEAMATLMAVAEPATTAEPTELSRTTSCRLSISRNGQELVRELTLTVPVGKESELLDQLAEQLPAQWQARHYPGSQRFYADAGDFVTVRGEVIGPGQVRLTFDTGCRPEHLPGQ